MKYFAHDRGACQAIARSTGVLWRNLAVRPAGAVDSRRSADDEEAVAALPAAIVDAEPVARPTRLRCKSNRRHVMAEENFCKSHTSLRRVQSPKRIGELYAVKRHQRTISTGRPRDPQSAQLAVARIAETMTGETLVELSRKLDTTDGSISGGMGSVDALLRQWSP
jgi:hypothetical protein